MNAEFGRIQFTPDLLPSDVVGLNRLDPKTGEFIFTKGPAFCNILLAARPNRRAPSLYPTDQPENHRAPRHPNGKPRNGKIEPRNDYGKPRND